MVSRLAFVCLVLCFAGCSAVTVHEARVCNMGSAYLAHQERQHKALNRSPLWTTRIEHERR